MTQFDDHTDSDENRIRVPRQRTATQLTSPLSVRIEIQTVQGEEAESLTRQQARAIRALLEWIARTEQQGSEGRSE